MAMRQVGMYMLRHPHRYYKYIEQELIDTGESYESYCYNVFHGNVWGDDLIASVFGDMWNIAITLISPIFKQRFDLFHTKDFPEIVVIANGGSYMSRGRRSTHFSSTKCNDEGFSKPGIELVNNRQGINPDLVYKRLEPTVLHDAAKAKKLGIDEYMKDEKERSLNLMYSITKHIHRMDNHIAHLIRESDKLKEEKKLMAFKMESLGISTEKIKVACTEQEVLPYMLTEEREREVIREERKRKLEKEKEEKEKQKKKKKIIETKDGKPIESEEIVVEECEEKEQEIQEEHAKKVISQQKLIIKSKEEIVQHQENKILQLQVRIQQLEMLQMQQQQHQQQEQQQQIIAEADEDITAIPVLDQATLETLNLPEQGVMQQVIPPTIPPAIQSAIPSTSSSCSMKLENFVKPELLKYLPGFKKEREDPTEPSVTSVEMIEFSQATPDQNVVFVPKTVEKNKALFLMPQIAQRGSSKRRNPGAPVPKNLRDMKRFYCEDCSCHYSKKYDLVKHVKWMCRSKIHLHVCDNCGKGFDSETGVKEHYYHEHLKSFLYHCTRCNKGFYFKSRKSSHKAACPNKTGAEKYKGKVEIDPELEKTFKRRKPVEMEIPEELMREIEDDEAECQRATETITPQKDDTPIPEKDDTGGKEDVTPGKKDDDDDDDE